MSQGTNFVANLQTNTSQSGAQSPIPRFHLPSTIRTKYYSFVFVDRPADKVSHPAIFSFKSRVHVRWVRSSRSSSQTGEGAQKTYQNIYLKGSFSQIDPSSYRLGKDPDRL